MEQDSLCSPVWFTCTKETLQPTGIGGAGHGRHIGNDGLHSVSTEMQTFPYSLAFMSVC